MNDWTDWVPATATRAYCQQDPLLDWLDSYGESKGFLRDDQQPDYDASLDFGVFVTRQGSQFQSAVLRHLTTIEPVITVATEPGQARSAEKLAETLAAMAAGRPLIAQAVLWDSERKTYGAADLLIRSDVLYRLFPDLLSADDARIAASKLGAPHHYRVVEIKFATLALLKDGHLGGNSADYMAQASLYNEALGMMQGYVPPAAYVLGRGWKAGDERVRSCMGRLARVDRDFSFRGGGRKGLALEELVADAVAWVRRLRREGAQWDVLPEPSVPELYPNAGNQEDGPWHAAKRFIARELDELTQLWYVGVPGRQLAHGAGVRRWTDAGATSAVLGVPGAKVAPTLDQILAINRDTAGPAVSPARVRAAEDIWRDPGPLEFYVDFETVSDLADDFSQIPDAGGQPLIFMVGCGHMEDGEWQFAQFVAERLDVTSERAMIDAWRAHMSDVTARLAPGHQPLIVHWSPHEPGQYDADSGSARARDPQGDWVDLRWFDFLQDVVRPEPVLARGALGFGLKAVAGALYQNGLIKTAWSDGPADGMAAMVGAWRCDEEAARLGCRLQDIPLMQAIGRYNEVDCRVMQEIVAYLREHH